MIPTLLNNRYRVLETLGSGGFGDTYLAEDTHLPSGRSCVIKRLKPFADRPQVYQMMQERFAREAAILEELGEGSDRIPKLYAYFVEGEHFYLVQELIEGVILTHKLQLEGLFSESLVRDILTDILPVLDYIHGKGIIHRDIKPSNIIYRHKDNKPVLIDFGIAKEIITPNLDNGSSVNNNNTIVIGTPGFMPPEQAAGKPLYSSDIYSLGMTVMCLLTGDSPDKLQIDSQSGEILWKAYNHPISNDLIAVLNRAIAMHPGDRFTDARSMLSALNPQDTFLATSTELQSESPSTISSSSNPSSLNQFPLQSANSITNPIGNLVESSILTQPPNPENTNQNTNQNTISADFHYTGQSYRNRQILLNKVRNYWVKGVLETSLHGVALIDLGLENRFDVLSSPWGMLWESSQQARQVLPPQTKVADLFLQMGIGRSLLILGEPGSGKTTTLLEITRDLVNIAENNVSVPIPVVFNLSAWTNPKVSIAKWLVKELNSKYQVSQEIGKNWIENQQLLLLLDGLDEVSSENREACILAINKFTQEYGTTEIIVCSRIKDYEALGARLNIQSAVFIQPLTLKKIQNYLESIGSELSAVKTALQTDTIMQDLAKSPLMLNIMTLAYKGISITDLPGINLEERRQHLFDKYIQRMLQRRIANNTNNQNYSHKRSLHYLSWLAKKMSKQSETVFLIERMQPSLLSTKVDKNSYYICCLLIYIIVSGLVGIQLVSLGRTVLSMICTAIFFWIFFGLEKIKPVEALRWSWKNARDNLLFGMTGGFALGIFLRLTILGSNVLDWSKNISTLSFDAWVRGIVFGLSLGLIFVLIRGLTAPSIQTLTAPNEGIWQSAKNAVVFGLISSIVLGIAAFILKWRIYAWAIYGLAFGIAAGGGEACAKHFVVRILLLKNGDIPWNYARFLNYATERIFLQKVGGGYIFVHRLLLEHFAQMSNE
ncbi:MAG: protein kinase [Mastigocoleus sp.]